MSGIFQSRLVTQEVKTTPQDITASWVDIGSEIVMAGFSELGLWIDLDINDSENVRIRVLAKNDEVSSTSEYNLPIKTVGSTDVKVESLYYEFNEDDDQKMLLEIDTSGHAKKVQIQIQAGTVGASAGQITSIYATKVWR